MLVPVENCESTMRKPELNAEAPWPKETPASSVPLSSRMLARTAWLVGALRTRRYQVLVWKLKGRVLYALSILLPASRAAEAPLVVPPNVETMS